MKLKYLLLLLPLLLLGCDEKKDNKPQPDPYDKYLITESNQTIDCNGGDFNNGKLTRIIIHSDDNRLENITIRNCNIFGSIRMYGLGINGEAPDVRASSENKNHTINAQKVAPRNIKISNVKIKEDGDIPIYISPGVTEVTLENSQIIGKSNSTGLYLDAESANNKIVNNTFDISVGREVIAVDGSAYNVIENNIFKKISGGGIYLYRNCGQGGTARHQTPSYNKILNNKFKLSNLQPGNYGIWLGSRNGNRGYCKMDRYIKYGSGISDLDYADNNAVQGNTFDGSDNTIRNDGKNNKVQQ